LLRDELKSDGDESLRKKIAANAMPEMKITGIEIDSLKNYDYPVSVRHLISFETKGEDVIYFNPAFYTGREKNKFTATARTLPVEFPFALLEGYTLMMDVPEGYSLEEVPKSVRMKYGSGEISFDYLISVSGNQIQFRTFLRQTKTFFPAEQYTELREFYSIVQKKLQEMIVFRKKTP
jgi:hypothetical protein